MNYRMYGCTVRDIASATGWSERKVRRDIFEERFNPLSVISLSRYVIKGVWENEDKVLGVGAGDRSVDGSAEGVHQHDGFE